MEKFKKETMQETKMLLKEYSELKRLIDSHKKYHATTLSEKQPSVSSVCNQNMWLTKKPSKPKSPVKTSSMYKVNRVVQPLAKPAQLPRESLLSQQEFLRNDLRSQNEVLKRETGVVANRNKLKFTANKKADQAPVERVPRVIQRTKAEINFKQATTKWVGHLVPSRASMSRTFSNAAVPFQPKPVQNKQSASDVPLHRPTVLPLPSSVGKKPNSKYKLVKVPDQLNSYSKSNVRKAKGSSRYSWRLSKNESLNKPQWNFVKKESKATSQTRIIMPRERQDSRSNIFKTKFKLLKARPNTSSSSLAKRTPKLIRRVNKYSVKYLPLTGMKTRYSQIVNRYRPTNFSFINKTADGCRQKYMLGLSSVNKNLSKHRKSELVVIGGILYKSSKNKLSRTERTKHEKSSNVNVFHNRNSSGVNSTGQKLRIVTVRGVRFTMDLNQKVLKRLPSPEENSSLTKKQETKRCSDLKGKRHGPSRIDIGGETYIQTRPGVLIRTATAHKRTAANRILNRSIYRLAVAKKKSEQFCMFYNKFGKCNNKEKGICRYVHDPDKIAVCKRFLRGECTIEACPFAHKICPAKMPVCTFFLHGRCSSDSCNYRHVNVNPNADVCLDFAKGYCALGEQCKKWHVTTCQEFEQTGQCKRGDKCPLTHKRRLKQQFKNGSSINLILGKRTLERDAKEELQHFPSKQPRLPSFIAISPPTDILESIGDIKGVTNKLQIKPDFKKHH